MLSEDDAEMWRRLDELEARELQDAELDACVFRTMVSCSVVTLIVHALHVHVQASL